MKKSGLLYSLENLKVRQEEEVKYITSLEIIDLLLDYINDLEIRKAVEEIPL